MTRGGHISNKLSTEEKVCPWSTSYLPTASISSLLSVICVLPSSLLLQANCHFSLPPPGYKDQAKKLLCLSLKLSTYSFLLVYTEPSDPECRSNLCGHLCGTKESSSSNSFPVTEELQIFIITTNEFLILLHVTFSKR